MTMYNKNYYYPAFVAADFKTANNYRFNPSKQIISAYCWENYDKKSSWEAIKEAYHDYRASQSWE